MKVVRWETPVSDVKSLSMVSLIDDGLLTIVVEGSQDSKRERFSFVFKKVFGYRNLPEEYRTVLWQSSVGTSHPGWTRRIVDSPWLGELREHEPLFVIHGGEQAVHYILCTEDDVVEILAKDMPEIAPAVAPTD